jgi:outer membrane receptor protein involved in Fe transport
VVTLDGIRLTDASGLGGVNLASVSLAGIERIEVQLGPCATKVGTDAMGGVIALISSSPKGDGWSGDLRGSMGTRGHRRGSADLAYGWKDGWVRLGADAFREDQATPTPEPFRIAGLALNAGQQLGGRHLLTATYRNSFVGVPLPWASVSPTTRRYADDREGATRQEQGILSLRSGWRGGWTTQVSAGLVQQDRLEPNSTTGRPNQPYLSRRGQVNAQAAWTGAGASFAFTAEGYEESGRTPGFPAGTNKGEGRHLGLGVEGGWEATESLRLTGALRHQWDRQGFVFPGAATAPDADSQATTGKAGATLLLPGGWRAYASFSRAFNLPLLSAVMYNQQNGHDADLGVERSANQQVGGGWSRGPWSLSAELSRTAYSDLIYFDLGTFAYAKGRDMRVQGAELRAAYTREAFGLTAFYRNQEARDQSAPAAEQLRSAAVIRRPFQMAGLAGQATFGAFRADLAWSWTGPRYENFGGFPSVLKASKVHFNDLAVGCTWTRSAAFSLALKGEYLLQPRLSVADWKARSTDGQNDAYLIFGYPAQPPVWRLEARYRF